MHRWITNLSLLAAVVLLTGCGDSKHANREEVAKFNAAGLTMPASYADIVVVDMSAKPRGPGAAAFDAAGPLTPLIDGEQLLRAKAEFGPYRVATGDILELTMPALLWAANADSALASSTVASGMGDRVWRPADDIGQRRRIGNDGAIELPIVGKVPVNGRTLIEIETAIAAAYHPKYIVTPPGIVVRIAEYNTNAVYIVGAVDKPGAYQLRHDEMSLVNLLMKAGGITKDGAEIIRIRRDRSEPKPVVVPVRGLNIPFADVEIHPGETVEVVRLNPQFFTVIGLVKKPGIFPYPPDTTFNLMQTLAAAGGVNELADPRQVTVYRRSGSGQIVAATFPLHGSKITDASNIVIRQGDVVAVEQTCYTATRLLLAEILHLDVGIQLIGWYGSRNILGD